ncbi:HAAS domain-containing protein [Bacillus sp. 179-C3.3 HS]|uniref:HAAS domain-containing protein n=1 Tax=Bacillus sp. 179-C3.3 HS TaxID=3232162 RepID=UPI0039A18587
MVTKETRHILLELKLYLISLGKNEEEIDDLMDELTTHAVEAEKDGKKGEEVFGGNPRAFADELAKELSRHYKDWVPFVSAFLIGSLFFMILSDAISQSLSYSWYALIGYPLILVANIIMIVVMFRASAFQTGRRAFFYFWILGVFEMTVMITVKLLDQQLGTPILTLPPSQRWNAIILMLLCIVIFNAILKVNIMSLIPLVFFGPQLLFEWIGWTSPSVLLILNLLSIVIILLVTNIVLRQTDKKNEKIL